jgi:hypothetical protein
MQSTLYLQRHIFACSVPEVVLLDLRRNRYLALPEHQSRLLASQVPGWPGAGMPLADQSAPPQTVAKVVDDLITQGILTRAPSQGKDATPAAIPTPRRTLLPEPQLIPQPAVSTWQRARRYLPAMFYSAITATAALRFKSIEHIVSKVSARRGDDRIKVDLPSLVQDFYWLRPFVFSGNQRCLFHSLTLLLFLSRFGIHPRWVFGVRKAPFAAHCWLQDGDAVLNDSVERVAMFTPIMVV